MATQDSKIPYLDYAKANRAASAGKRSAIVGAIAAIVFMLVALVPFPLIGQSAAYFWMYWNAPLSWFVESHIGLSIDTWGLIGLVVLINAICWGSLTAAICYITLSPWKTRCASEK